MDPTFRKGSPIPASLRERAQRALETYGHRAVYQACSLSEGAFWRALAGGPVHAASALALTHALDVLDANAT